MSVVRRALAKISLHRLTAICTALGLILAMLACPAHADTMLQATSPGQQASDDSLSWSQLGGNATAVASSFAAASGKGVSIAGSLGGSGSIVAVVCPASECSWAPAASGFNSGDSLL